MKLKERILIISLLLLASAGARAEVNTGVYLNKTATYDYATQTGTIKLENYVGQVTKIIHLGQSAEIVLAVDGSSSMGSTGMTKLHAAVKSFITELYNACAADRAGDNLGIDHRVSLVVFGNNANMLCNFKSVYYETGTTPYANAAAAASAFDQMLLNVCTRSDNTYTSNGTMTHMALGLAYYIMNGNYSSIYTSDTNNLPRTVNGTSAINQNWTSYWITNSISITGARSKDDSDNTCSRYVVLMTDGALEGTPNGGTKLNGDALKKAGRDEAVAVSRLLKADDVSIYTVGFLDSENLDLYNMLNNVSSNHLTPTSASDPADKLPHDYFSLVSKTGDASALSNIFSKISEEVATGCAAVNLDETKTEVKDVVNNEYFKLPDGTDASKITVYTVPCTGYDYSTETYSFGTTQDTPPTSVVVSIDADADGNQRVNVKGFDYTANWCGAEYISASQPNEPHGCKLVVEIPFIVNSYSGAIGEQPTNITDGSGFFAKTTATPAEDLNQLFASPTVDLYELTISRTGLKAGESAIYRVTDKDGKLIYTIALTGTGGSGAVKQKVLYVPDGNVTVTETGWGWANRPSTATITNTISASNSKPTYSFSGSSTSKNPEDYKKNEFNN